MTSNILVFLWLVLVLFLLSYAVRKYLNKSSLYSFQSWEKSDLPFITLNVQGHSLNMITDSAAAVSIIRKDALKDLTYEPSSRHVNLSSITDDGLDSAVVCIPITINGKEIRTDFVVYDSDDIASFRKHGIIVDGLLGVEFFKATKGLIDFNKQSVIFP